MDLFEKLAAFDGRLTFTHAPFKFAKVCATPRISECKDRSLSDHWLWFERPILRGKYIRKNPLGLTDASPRTSDRYR